ncbi:MAG: methyltransferase domain-containing protein [Halioglobus sp.]
MSFLFNSSLRCPLDHLPLQCRDNLLECEQGHSFDVARQGYVNLLSASEKRSKDPGDSKEMVRARRDFLDAGHYQPIADTLVTLVEPFLNNSATIVDAGCGEGYYLQQLMQSVTAAKSAVPSIVGFDISKWAVQHAAKRLSATWLVASNRNIPIADHGADILLSLFGFPTYESFRRVLKPAGTLILVNAGPRHLIELREIIYPSVNDSVSSEVMQAQEGGFTLRNTQTLSFQTKPLQQAEILQLLGMTPHFFRVTSDGRERALALDNFSVTVDVDFHVLR